MTESQRPYQVSATNDLVRLKRAPLIAPMGSGKSRIALDAVFEQIQFQDVTPIICPRNAVATWIREVQKWYNIPEDDIEIAIGNPTARAKAWSRAYAQGKPFIITTYLSYIKDSFAQRDPTAAILDEPHRYIRNRTKTWKGLCNKLLHSEILILVDGTPLRRGPQDFYTYLHMCRRNTFSSYWKFVKTWCTIVDGLFGKEIIGPKNMTNFKQEIWGKYCAWVPASECDEFLPEKNRILVPTIVTAKQRSLIEEIEQQVMEIDEEHIMLMPNMMSQIMRERQVLVTPKIFNASWGDGAALDWLADCLDNTSKDRPVVFTPFAAAFPHVVDKIESVIKGPRRVYTLRGGTSLMDQTIRVGMFNHSQNDVMLCSTTYAESFEFPNSTECFGLGFDWSMDVNEQAEDRLRRLTNESPKITAYYPRHLDTVDGRVLEVMNDKARNVRLVTPKNLQEILR